ncbi:unnamed protein product, partial [Symbiodinium necroappetens]
LFIGNYTEWHNRETKRKREADEFAAMERAEREKEEKKRRQAEHREREQARTKAGPTANSLSRLKTEQLEKRIEELETKIKSIDEKLASPDVWQNHSKAEKLGKERAALVEELEPLEFEWMSRAGA